MAITILIQNFLMAEKDIPKNDLKEAADLKLESSRLVRGLLISGTLCLINCTLNNIK